MSYSRTYLKSRTPREISEMAGLKRGPIETGHKQFDKAANGAHGHIGTGNVFSANQRSGFIRAHSKTFCNGRVSPEGHLQDFDLKSFTLPASIEKTVRDAAREKDVILYQIQSGGEAKTVHGYLITDTFYRHLHSFTGRGPKSYDVMEAVTDHLSWNDRDLEDPVPTEEIEAITEDFSAGEFEALAAHQGYGSATDAASCRESGLHFHDENPYSTWREDNPPQTMSRAETPGLAAALLVIRSGMDLDALRDWTREMRRQHDIDGIGF